MVLDSPSMEQKYFVSKKNAIEPRRSETNATASSEDLYLDHMDLIDFSSYTRKLDDVISDQFYCILTFEAT